MIIVEYLFFFSSDRQQEYDFRPSESPESNVCIASPAAKRTSQYSRPPNPFLIVVSVLGARCMIIVVSVAMLGAETIFLHAHDVHQIGRKKLLDGKMIGRAAPSGVRSLRHGNSKESTSFTIKHRRRRAAVREKSHYRSELPISRSKSTALSSGDLRSRLRMSTICLLGVREAFICHYWPTGCGVPAIASSGR